ncbi:unnamed protein product, partial [Strongylus vulgaris]
MNFRKSGGGWQSLGGVEGDEEGGAFGVFRGTQRIFSAIVPRNRREKQALHAVGFKTVCISVARMCDDEVAALVVDNGSGMCKAGF